MEIAFSMVFLRIDALGQGSVLETMPKPFCNVTPLFAKLWGEDRPERRQ
jgi:hypothetical protein